MSERYTPIIMDSDRDTQQVGFDGIVMTAGNFNAEIAKMEAIETALQAILLGTIVASNRLANFDQISATPYVAPTNPAAQIHTKWLFTFKETATGAIWHRKVPGADYAAATLQDDESNWSVDLGSGDGAALKTALDAFVTHPDLGTAGTLISIKILED